MVFLSFKRAYRRVGKEDMWMVLQLNVLGSMLLNDIKDFYVNRKCASG